ncbi:alpha/beta hydrolase [Vermiphilus pyriformis]|uniref:Peptidase S9 prolyl oligopeptidase catalytic domain-containing protein n=1 Tax=candidate division TM6 bacterium JCVI TM6SC1 TaxID=1306947 RepID=A0A0D2I1W3_9BACT|nr:hypothetical protein J120_02405 [candidate division TM6 bacterium JCVI TM6SC1]UNE35214.1 MAG: alpha/beta hydrolase [Vermiphilus pyriformis]
MKISSIHYLRTPLEYYRYEDLSPYEQSEYSLEEYNRYCTSLTTIKHIITWYRLIYQVDDIDIQGYIGMPASIQKLKYPAIIYCRGGCGDEGKITLKTLSDNLNHYIQGGFVVLATQYRGIAYSQGHDECGGQELEDVLALYTIATQIPEVDIERVYLVGFSRGTIMAWQALARKLPVKAAAMISGIADLRAMVTHRPVVYDILLSAIPNFTDNEQQAYQHRSALYWIDKINTPVILIANQKDPIVDVLQTYTMSAELEKHTKVYRSYVYDGMSHSLSEWYGELHKRIINFFNMY